MAKLIPRNLRDQFVGALDAANDDDAPDGAWWQRLEDAARWFCEDHGLRYEECDMVHLYLRLKDPRQR